MKESKLKGCLVGVDGNAFAIMGYFKRRAKEQGWNSAQVNIVLEKAMSGDYDNLLSVIASQFEDPLKEW